MKAVLKGIRQSLITIALSFVFALVTIFGINQVQATNAVSLANTLTDYNLAQVNYTRTDLDSQTSAQDKTSSKHLIDNSRTKLKENTEEVRKSLNGDESKAPEAGNFMDDIQEKVSNIFGGKEDSTHDRSHSRTEQ